jgi:hypothetical protein
MAVTLSLRFRTPPLPRASSSASIPKHEDLQGLAERRGSELWRSRVDTVERACCRHVQCSVDGGEVQRAEEYERAGFTGGGRRAVCSPMWREPDNTVQACRRKAGDHGPDANSNSKSRARPNSAAGSGPRTGARPSAKRDNVARPRRLRGGFIRAPRWGVDDCCPFQWSTRCEPDI